MYGPIATVQDRMFRRVAAVGAIVFVASFVVAVLLSGPPVVHEGQAGLEHSLSGRRLPMVLASLVVLSIGLVALMVTLAYLTQALGLRTIAGSLASRVAWGAGLGYVLVLLGVALPTGAAAAWALHHEQALATVLVVNNVRNFCYLAILPLMGVTAIGLGVAALGERELTRWVGWGGLIVGGLSLLALPAAAVGISYAMPLWLLWWAGVAVSLLRGRPTRNERGTPADRLRSGTLDAR